MKEKELSLISFVAPTDSHERIKQVVEHSSKFIYLVAYAGITGSGASEDLSELDGFGDEEENSDLEGFGDSDELSSERSEEVVEESMFSLSGNVKFKTSYGYRDHSVYAQKETSAPFDLYDNIDYLGVNQAQMSTYLQLDGKLSDNWKVRISGDAFYDAIYDIRNL